MIKVTAYGKERKLKIRGHSGAAAKGEDIICAAASFAYDMFKYTLLANTDKCKVDVAEDDGKAEISYTPTDDDYASAADLLFRYTVNGLLLLAENYPDNVKVILR